MKAIIYFVVNIIKRFYFKFYYFHSLTQPAKENNKKNKNVSVPMVLLM